MKRSSATFFLGFGLLLLALAANAQPMGYQNGRYGYGRNSGSLIGQVMSDLDMAASNARLDGHERGHFDQAMQKLQEFEGRWAQGNFDTGKLDKAIESLDHLANADRIRPRDRDLLSQDLAALREFRSNRGRQYSNGRNGEYRVGSDNRYNEDYRQRGDYRDSGGYQNGRYGYGRNSGSLIGRVMSDLNMAASNARLDGHERGHFDQAMQKLQEFEGRWAQGNFDTGKLDKAIESLDHLANADRIGPRDRDLLSQDLAALREFRSTRGGQYLGR